MKMLPRTVITSTNIDLNGEKLNHIDLIELLSQLGGQQPLQMDHDLSIPHAGYIDNFQIIEKAGEFYLIGDAHVNEESVETVASKTGMSYSITSTLKRPECPDIGVFLPFPYYNDADLIDSIYSENIEVGKWIKKSAEITTGVAIISFVVWTSTQIGTSFYKTVIEPVLLPVFKRMGKRSESFFYDYHGSCMDDDGNIVKVTFLNLNLNDFYDRNDLIENGMRTVDELLKSNINHDFDPIDNVRLNRKDSLYAPIEIRHKSGSIMRSPL